MTHDDEVHQLEQAEIADADKRGLVLKFGWPSECTIESKLAILRERAERKERIARRLEP